MKTNKTFMQRIFFAAMLLLASVSATAQDNAQQPQSQRRQRYVISTDAPISSKQSDGTVVINTSALCKDVRGYRDMTPVEIYILKNKVVKVEALRNNEGPKYMKMVLPILDQWKGKKVADAQKLKVDAVTGATFTSNAIIENVQQGLKYYQEKK